MADIRYSLTITTSSLADASGMICNNRGGGYTVRLSFWAAKRPTGLIAQPSENIWFNSMLSNNAAIDG